MPISKVPISKVQVSKDKVVSFHYKIYEGEVMLEDSGEGDQILYMHGRGGMLEGLEAVLEGKQTGDAVEVTLAPHQAYGERHDKPFQRIAIKHLMPKSKPRLKLKSRPKPRIGDVFQVNTKGGAREVVIMKIGKFNVDVDTNHPLAGKTLRFEIEVGEVWEATQAELAHGHAHGPGGHDH